MTTHELARALLALPDCEAFISIRDGGLIPVAKLTPVATRKYKTPRYYGGTHTADPDEWWLEDKDNDYQFTEPGDIAGLLID